MLLYDWYITIIVELSTITSWCYISILVFIVLWKNISNFPWMITSESMIPRFNNYIYYLFVWFTHAYHSTPYSLMILLLEQQLYIDIKWRKKTMQDKTTNVVGFFVFNDLRRVVALNFIYIGWIVGNYCVICSDRTRVIQCNQCHLLKHCHTHFVLEWVIVV